MTALAIPTSPRHSKKSPGRVTRFSTESTRVGTLNHSNALTVLQMAPRARAALSGPFRP